MKRSSSPITPQPWPNWSIWQALAVALSLTWWFLSGLIFMTVLIGIGLGFAAVTSYLKVLQIPPQQIVSWVESGLKKPPLQTQGSKNILILGVDTIAGRGDVPALTDTMMIASLNLTTGNITLLPLPRDLWSPEYQAKINSLFWYGTQQQPTNPTQLPTQVVSTLIGQPIHHTVVLSLDQVSQVIDILGGIEVTVERGFVDEFFPRPGVDVTVVRDPAILYQRVEFVAGPTIMNGATALTYIRSRKSVGDEGDDIARSHRQQQVISALVSKLRSRQLWQDPSRLQQLYQMYLNNWAEVLPMTELVSTGKSLLPHRNSLQLSSRQLSIWPEDPQGVIWHPPLPQTQNQWVYQVRDSNRLHSQIKNWFQPSTNSATASGQQP